jgi:hypothetical protein
MPPANAVATIRDMNLLLNMNVPLQKIDGVYGAGHFCLSYTLKGDVKAKRRMVKKRPHMSTHVRPF